MKQSTKEEIMQSPKKKKKNLSKKILQIKYDIKKRWTSNKIFPKILK